MPDIDGYKDLYAFCDHMPGKPNNLRAGGVVTMRTTGWKATLLPYEDNGGINPFRLHLELVLTREGDVGGDQIDVVTIEEHVIEEPGIEYTEVQLHLTGDSDDPPPPIIEVVHTQ